MQGRCDDIERRRRAQVARVRLELAGDAPPGLRITVNGRAVPPSVLGLELPVRVGSVTVQGAAEGFEVFTETVTIAAEQTRGVSLRLSRVVAPVVAPVVEVRRRVWEAVLGGALAAGGVVVAGIGAYNLGMHGTEMSDPTSHTIHQRCAPGAPLQSTAQGAECGSVGAVSPILVGAGAAAVGVGVFLVYDGLRARSVTVARVRPAVTLGRMGGSVGVELLF